MPLLPVRRCSKCGSIDVSRSRRRSFFERYLLRFALLRPYHCWACNFRFYGFRYSRKAAEAPLRKKGHSAGKARMQTPPDPGQPTSVGA